MGIRAEPLDARRGAPQEPRRPDRRPTFDETFGAPGRYLGWVLALVVAVVIAVSLARVVLQAADASAQVEQLRASNDELRARVEALAAEKHVVTSPIFVDVAGRAHGYGDPDERAFGLLPGGPPAPRLDVPAVSASDHRGSPLEAWLTALLGP
jgi:hypothetical protein